MPAALIGSQTRCTAELHDVSANGCLLLLPNDPVKLGTFGRLGIQVGRETLRRLLASLSTARPANA